MDMQNPVWRAIRRGFFGRCPNCGRGPLFRAYLKPVAACADCHESFAEIHADDGPAWLTILVVGHVVVASALIVETSIVLPLWFSMCLFAGLSLLLTLMLLQRAKGVFISVIWAMKATGIDAQAR